MIAQHDVIISSMTQWDTHFVEPDVFGTTDPHTIASLIDTFCQEELGAHVADYLFYESSVGAVCGVRLMDGRRVVVKVHQSSRSLDFLQAVVRVQRYLISHGYPCTKPLFDPRPLALGIATTAVGGTPTADQCLLHRQRVVTHPLAVLARRSLAQRVVEQPQRLLAMVAGTGHKLFQDAAPLWSVRRAVAWSHHR